MKLKEISLNFGEVAVHIKTDKAVKEVELGSYAMSLINELRAKMRREVKYSISGEPADLEDKIEENEENEPNKVKSNDRSKQISASYA